MENKNLWQRMQGGLELVVSSYRARRGDLDAWEKTIQRFEIQDQSSPPPKDAIVFIGSSSFTFWSTLEQDMAPLAVINRGFGGSYMRDAVKYLHRIVVPYQPRAVVLFAGTNDITRSDPNLADTVFEGYRSFVTQVHAALPEIRIYYVGITPTPTRWKYWPIAQEANRRIREYTEKMQNMGFIDLTDELLNEDGRPNRRLYRWDGIHPNEMGYARWTTVIKSRLEADFSAA